MNKFQLYYNTVKLIQYIYILGTKHTNNEVKMAKKTYNFHHGTSLFLILPNS